MTTGSFSPRVLTALALASGLALAMLVPSGDNAVSDRVVRQLVPYLQSVTGCQGC